MFEHAWRDLVEVIEAQFSVTPRLLDGVGAGDAASRLAELGIEHSGMLVEWFAWQGGLDPDCGVRTLFDGIAPQPLAWIEQWWTSTLAMHAEIEADDPDLDYTIVESWPKPGWCPIDLVDGYTIVDTQHPQHPGRVLRAWARDLDVIAHDLVDLLRRGANRIAAGETIPELIEQ